MAISKTIAQDLCSKIEFNLVEASFPQNIKLLTGYKLKMKIASCKKYLGKWKDLVKKQARELASRKKKGERVPIEPHKRTIKKVQLFEETLVRFEKQQKKLIEKAAREKKEAERAKAKKAAKKQKVKTPPVPKKITKKGKGRHEIPLGKKNTARNKKISSHQRSANKRVQAKRDRR